MIPRAVATVLADASARREQGWEFVLTATYVEIYNERIRDLLSPASDNLKVRVGGSGEGVLIAMHGAQSLGPKPHTPTTGRGGGGLTVLIYCLP